MKTQKMDMKDKLSLLWIFALFNYLYCDIVTLMDSSVLTEILRGYAGSIQITQGFLLGASVLVEIPIAMVLLSRFLSYRANRWGNIVAGATMTAVQVSSLFVGTPTNYYVFFSIIEIATTSLIVWYAWNWMENEN